MGTHVKDADRPAKNPLLVGADTETFPIAQEQQAPRLVCLSLAVAEPKEPSGYETDLLVNADWEKVRGTARQLLSEREVASIWHRAAFDLSVLAANFPDLIPTIFEALERERVHDTLLREKLLVLTRTGDLEFLNNPDGSKSKRQWNLAALVKQYFGVDISADKTADDAWRTNYNQLDTVPLEQWPEKAKTYVIDDAVWVRKIYDQQEEQRLALVRERGLDPFLTEGFRVLVDFCLALLSCRGAATDPVAVAALEAEMAKELAPDKLPLLLSTGILRPAEPPRPMRAKAHVESCPRKGDCACPPKMTQGKDESIDTGKLKAYVLELASRLNAACEVDKVEKVEGEPDRITWKNAVLRLKYTDKSSKFPHGQLSIDAEFLEDFAHLDPVLGQYKHRQDLQKIVSTELPRMKLNGQVAPVVHPQYDPLKETGRTSSFSSKATTYASFNAQNVDPRARQCYVPRAGHWLFSIDYSQMELGTLAQKCYSLFGQSVLRDTINAGIDVHAFMGMRLARAMDGEFIAAAGTLDEKAALALFREGKAENSPWHKTYKTYRKMAKPVNFGYPGGLGPKTFIRFAKASYQVTLDYETAKTLKELWLATYPEMAQYFTYVNEQCQDSYNLGFDEDTKEQYYKYQYDTPMGLHRAGCDYCACCNGLGVQSPAAEGSLTGMVNVVRACYDAAMGSVLYGRVFPWGFIHDEIVGEIMLADPATLTAQLEEMRRILIAAMRIITPDVKVDATPVLMARWNKDAEQVRDAQGNIGVWAPKA